MTIVMCKMYVMCAIRGIYLVLGKWEGQEESMELVILWLKLQVRVTLTITSKWSGEVKVLQAEPVYSVVSDFFDPWTISPPSYSVHGISQAGIQEWFPFPHPEHLPNPVIEPASSAAPALINGFFTTEPPGKPVPGRENPKPLVAGGWQEPRHPATSYFHFKYRKTETSLVVQWLRICTSIAGDMGSIPGQGTKIPRSCMLHCTVKK